MNANFFTNVKGRRYFFILLGVCLFCSILTASALFGLHSLSKKINENREKIAITLKEELGFQVTFEDIQARWFGYTVGVILKNVVISNTNKPDSSIAFADFIKIFPDLTEFFFHQTLKPKKIIVVGLKMDLELGKKDNPQALNALGQEQLLTGLSKVETLKLEAAEIHWKAPEVEITQFLTAKLKWAPKNPLEITGNHVLQIRDGQRLPESRFTITVNPEFQAVALNIDANGIDAQCQFEEKAQWQANCVGNFNKVEITELHDYYVPKKTDPKLLLWLAETLQSGTVNKATVKMLGPLDALKFEGEVNYHQVDFQYAPGWPKIEKANGVVNIGSKEVSVQLSHGAIMNAPIEIASAIISPINETESPVVSVSGSVNSNLETGLLFLKESPLKDSIAPKIEPLGPTGPMALQLKLMIPIETNKPVEVDGILATEAGHLKLTDWASELENLKGDFHFTTQSLEASHVTALWQEHPLKLSVETEKNMLKVTGESLFSSDFLQQQWPFPFTNALEGESEWAISYRTPLTNAATNNTEWVISSNLEGMAIHLPKPLEKEREGKRLLTITYREASPTEDKITFNIEKIADMKVVAKHSDKQSDKQSDQSLKIARGHVVLGEGYSDWTSLETLLIEGEIALLKVGEWSATIGSLKEKKHLPTVDLHLLVHKLDIHGLQFEDTWITSNSLESSSSWALAGPSIKGTVAFLESTENPLKIDLSYLKIAGNTIQNNSTTELFNSQDKFPILFYCQNLQYNQGNFGETTFKLLPKPYGYEIQSITIGNRYSELTGAGEWHLNKEGSETTLQGKIISASMGSLFSEWGFPSVIRESSGYVEYNLSWAKSPFQFSLASAEGKAELKFKKGRILGVNPGLGRILGLLSLENIKRRLQLDFSDVFKKGFVFDEMKGEFEFNQGTANTKELLIDGPSAKIELTGTADLNQKTVDLKMGVVPQVGVGLPIAAAIAVGNPAVGAGVWVLDKLTGSKMNKLTGKITQNYYRVTGSWDAPHIQELGESTRRQNQKK